MRCIGLTRYIRKFVFNCEHFFAYFWKARGSRGDAAVGDRGGKGKERLGSRPLSQDMIALEKSAKARRLRSEPDWR